MSYSMHKPMPRKLCVVLFYVQKKFGSKTVGEGGEGWHLPYLPSVYGPAEKRLRSLCENIEERSVGVLVSFKRLQISLLKTIL